jgi:hypothetical protein
MKISFRVLQAHKPCEKVKMWYFVKLANLTNKQKQDLWQEISNSYLHKRYVTDRL